MVPTFLTMLACRYITKQAIDIFIFTNKGTNNNKIMHYNFARPHKTLATPYPTTPAMAAGATNHIWTVEEIVKLAN